MKYIETYENFYSKISEDEIIDLFNKHIKNNLPKVVNFVTTRLY